MDLDTAANDAAEPKPLVNPLDGIPHYKDQLKDFLANPSAMRRLRKDVESLLEEQLIDHEVEPRAKGLSRSDFNELSDVLGQERQHFIRKFPNFEEIRAALARKVDRLALQALHSKREHSSPSPNRGESFKRARPSRGSERGRPTSGRPASLTSLATTLSPIAEHRRGATASPSALRQSSATNGPNQAISKQSLFEDDSGNEEDEADAGEVYLKKKDEKEAQGKRKEGTTKKPQLPNNDEEDDDKGEERIDGKSTSPGPSVKFSDENLHKKDNNDDEIDYRFVRRKVDSNEDDEDEDDEEENDELL